MAPTTMAARLLDAADLLLEQGRRSTAFRRRAVSTAYYATFHALAKLCADYLTHSARRSSVEYSRVYRALEHGTLKNAFAQSPLKDNASLSRIGAVVVRLQAERHRADYLPPTIGVFTNDETRELLDQAREIVTELEKLGSQKVRLMATCLMFRERKQ